MGVTAWVLFAVLAAVAGALWVVVYQVLRQQGRILLRIEELEARSAGPSEAERRPRGLPVATQVPSFRLPDLSGSTVQFEDYRGLRVLLVHWDPGCSFCERIAPEMTMLQQGLTKQRTELVLLSYGEPERNRVMADEHGLRCPILLQPNGSPVEAFATLGTPAAYLLDEKGRIAKPLALGSDQVLALAREASGRKARLESERSLAESRLEREGIPAGSPAPTFELPDVYGRKVSLNDYRGRRVLLVFSDPDCGPCDSLMPELAEFYRTNRQQTSTVILVSRGEPEANRRKNAEHGIEFPVVIQPGWRLSKRYGIFATPVGFLVDERGVIARDVARGGPEIMRLAREGLTVREEAPTASLNEAPAAVLRGRE
jgi:peroxiredoxin